MPNEFTKAPIAKLDYGFDWRAKTNGVPDALTDWLQPTETISSYVVTVPDGLTKDSDSLALNGSRVIVWLTGGTDGMTYIVSCTITTNQNRIDEQSIAVAIH